MKTAELIERIREDKKFLQKQNKEYREEISRLRKELEGFSNAGLTPEEIKDILSVLSENQDDVDEDGISRGLIHDLLELSRYRQAEEQGLLIKLPCKVTDVVYHVHEREIKEYAISSVGGIDLRVITKNNYNPCLCQFNSETIGKTVFLTREEAEQALKGGASE